MTALNAAYAVSESRPPWKVYRLSIIDTTGIAVLIMAATSLLSIGRPAAQWLAGRVGHSSVIAPV
jgi:membrane protein